MPKTKSLAAIDAWIPEIGAFKIIVGNTHSINFSVGDDCCDFEMLGQEAKKLYWLLPPQHYTSFTTKSLQGIDQYAVLIPYAKVVAEL